MFFHSWLVSLAIASCSSCWVWMVFDIRSCFLFSWRFLLRFSSISCRIKSRCWMLFSLTFLNPSRVVVLAPIFVDSSVSRDFRSPILIWTSRTLEPPSSTKSELSLLHSLSIEWRRVLMPSRIRLRFSTFFWASSSEELMSATFASVVLIWWESFIASNRLISFRMKLYWRRVFLSLSRSSTRFCTSSILPIAVRIEISAAWSFSSASAFSASYWAIPTRSSTILRRSVEDISVMRVIVPCNIMLWPVEVIPAIDNMSFMFVLEIRRPLSR